MPDALVYLAGVILLAAAYGLGFAHGVASMQKKLKQFAQDVLALARRFVKGGKHDTAA